MKKLLISLFALLTINVSAQIVQFSDELLSQYDNKKQEDILTRPIDLDMIYTPFDLSHGNISDEGEFSANFYNNYNYIGYHLYVPKSKYDDEYVLSFNLTYDTVALDVMPEGVYEVVGMIITKEEVEDLRNLIMDTLIICKENSITYGYKRNGWVYNGGKSTNLSGRGSHTDFTYRDFLSNYCDKHIIILGSVADINRAIHNGEKIDKARATLILKGNNNHLYYLSMVKSGEPGYAYDDYNEIKIASRDLRKAFIVEQYEYMKDYLLNNEFVIQSFKPEFEITTDKGLKYHFSDTVGLRICDFAVKDGENYESMDFITVMKIGPDSILYYDATYWSNQSWYIDRPFDGHVYSDTIEYIRTKLGYKDFWYTGRDDYFSIVRKCDVEKIKRAELDYENRLKAYKTNLEAARIAEQKRNERIKAEREAKRIAEQREWERKRQAEKQSLIAKYGAKYGALVFEHKVTLGMTKEMCQQAWGRPRNKVIRRLLNGTQEVWSYGVSQYLVFDNGVLVECASRS